MYIVYLFLYITSVSQVPTPWLSARLHDRSAHGIAADVGQLIKHGDLTTGARMPPVRELAAALGTSPSTVSGAWRQLRARGMLTGGGRAGMVVGDDVRTPRPIRYGDDGQEGDWGQGARFPLNRSVPDPGLLPDLHTALIEAPASDDLNHYTRIPIVPRLAAAARAEWPYPAGDLMVANGGYEGLMLAVHTFLRPGDHVLLDNPATPRTRDILDAVGCRIHFLDRDSEGIRPDALAAALPLRPAALLLQPAWHNPAGTMMSERRRDELAAIIADHPLLVIEDDGHGPLVGEPVHCLGAVLEQQHLLVRSYSKSHGPDLRIAIVEGDRDSIERVRAFRDYGSGWTSRPLQEALAWLLTDAATQRSVALARDTYHRRRRALHAELVRRGVPVEEGCGLELWVPVRDERYAVVTLAAHQIAVVSGSRFTPADRPPHVRVSTGTLAEADAPEVAEALARAAQLPFDSSLRSSLRERGGSIDSRG
ncbi:DNA-binding transcriptional MocR family regulator [Propionibacteriaceae bacterium ES.041]|nr:GntR family transcriptional regulator [Enemella evansiae]OYO01290.1 GntR family transcriptional regulator [Enemella evansiae]PFG67507.1 DNA-binding transcriptional MocR family regulator [Propionibacteriaceae bacterium ES.041]